MRTMYYTITIYIKKSAGRFASQKKGKEELKKMDAEMYDPRSSVSILIYSGHFQPPSLERNWMHFPRIFVIVPGPLFNCFVLYTISLFSLENCELAILSMAHGRARTVCHRSDRPHRQNSYIEFAHPVINRETEKTNLFPGQLACR